jgi:hypothetical protein
MVARFKLARHPIDRRNRVDDTAMAAIFLVIKEEKAEAAAADVMV